MKDLLRKLSGLPLYEGELEKGSVSMETAKKLADAISFDGDVKEFAENIAIEMEHANTIKKIISNKGTISVEEVAAMIVMDHLREYDDYYDRLKKAKL